MQDDIKDQLNEEMFKKATDLEKLYIEFLDKAKLLGFKAEIGNEVYLQYKDQKVRVYFSTFELLFRIKL